MKNISTEQINVVLQTIYNTNISAQTMDSLKKFFQDLPEVKSEIKPEIPVANKK